MFNFLKIAWRTEAPLKISPIAGTKRVATIGALSNLVGLIGNKCIGLMLAIMLTRSLSVGDFGTFNLFLSIVGLLGGVSLGVDKVIQRYFPMLLQTEPDHAAGLFIIFMSKRYLVLAALVVIGYAAIYAEIFHLEQIKAEYLAIAAATAAIIAGRMGTMNALNSAYLDHGYLNTAALTGDLFKLVGLFFFSNGQIIYILLIWTLAESVVLVMLTWRLLHKMRRGHAPGFSFGTIRRLDYKRYYHFAKYFAIASLGTYMLSAEFDYLFLSFFDNRDAIGLYAFAAKLPFILLMIAPSNIMFNITLPLLIERIDAGQDIEAISTRMVTFLKLNILVWTIMASVVAFNIETIISQVFDPKYLPAKNLIYGWFLLLYALVIKNVFEPVARALEYAKVYRLTFFAAIVNLLGNFCLIPVFGLTGAIVASGIAITMQGYLSSFETMRRMHLPFNRTQALRSIARILAVVVFVLLCNIPYQTSISEQLWRNSLLLFVLGVLFWPWNFFSPEDRKYIVSFVAHVRKT